MAKKRVSKKSYKVPDEDLSSDIVTQETMTSPSVSNRKSHKFYYAILTILVLVALLLANKSWVVVGVVNGRPIWRWDLNNLMTSRFGKQTLENMVSEELIAEEAKKQHVAVTQADINAKQNEILKNFGGNVKLDDLLKYQGITKVEFENQLRLQLTVQKILGRDIQITEQDVDKFLSTNKGSLTATDPAKLREEARQAILDSKVSEKIQPWFAALKEKAKILRFL